MAALHSCSDPGKKTGHRGRFDSRLQVISEVCDDGDDADDGERSVHV